MGHEFGATVYHGQLVSDQSSTIQVSGTARFPSAPFIIEVDQERMLVTSVDEASDTLTVQRGMYGTSPMPHAVDAELKQGRLVQVDDTSSFDGRPFLARMESEQFYVVGVDHDHHVIEIERGANRTIPVAHDPGPMRYALEGYGDGFYGTDDYPAYSRLGRFFDATGDGGNEADSGAGEALYFIVTSTVDEPDLTPGNGTVDTASGNVSLRAAVMEINAQQAVGTILVPQGTYLLDSQLLVSSKVRILGDDAQTTVLTTNGSDRVLTVSDSGVLELVGVTVTSGSTQGSGGGILVDGGSLRLTWSVVSGCTAAQGGAIHNDGGVLNIVNTSLINNTADSGGALSAIGGSTTLSGTTISGNTGTSSAGGIWVGPSANLSIFNSTIASNNGPDTGGIRSIGTTRIANSIVAANTSSDGSDTKGRFVSLGHNLIGSVGPISALTADATANETQLTVEDGSILPAAPFTMLVGGSELMLVTGIDGNVLTVARGQDSTAPVSHFNGTTIRWDGFYQASDQTSFYGPLDPMLGPLQLNQGTVPTHAVGENSPALDAGDLSLFRGVSLELSRSIGWFYDALVYDTIPVNRWGLVPEGPFTVDVGGIELNVDSSDYHNLHLATPEDTMTLRRTPVRLLTDARGAPLYFYDPMATTDRLDAGAFEFVTTYSIDPTPVVLTEGTGAQPTVFQFVVSRSERLNDPTRVYYKVVTSGNESADGDDFHNGVMDCGTVEFYSSQTQQVIQVEIAADSSVEAEEHFQVVLYDPSPGGWILDSVATGTIVDDDVASLSVSNPSTTEGNVLAFDITLASGIEGGFALEWMTADGTATESDQDFVPASGTAYFSGAPGETVRVHVASLPDNTVETDETIQLLVGGIHQIRDEFVGLIALPGPALGTILNNDETTLGIDGARLVEGNSGQHNVVFTARLSPNPSAIPITADVVASGISATDGVDFVDSGTMTIVHSGQTEDTVSISIPIVGDLDIESDEQFSVSLTNVQAGGSEASIQLSNATATIVDDDSPSLIIRDAWISEADAGTASLVFDVVLSNPLGPVAIDIATTDSGTATAAEDFVASSQTLSFSGADGESLTFAVPIFPDDVVERDETVAVALSNLQAGGNEASYRLVSGLGTIWNDDYAGFSITANEPAYEYDGVATFIVTLEGQVDVPVTVTMSTAEPTSIGDAYYGPISDLVFSGAAGESHEYRVALRNDGIDNPSDLVIGVTILELEADGRNVSDDAALSIVVLDDEDLSLSEIAGQNLGDDEDDSLMFRNCDGEEVWVGSLRPPTPEYEFDNPIYIDFGRAYENADEPTAVMCENDNGYGCSLEQIMDMISYSDGVLTVDGSEYIVPLPLVRVEDIPYAHWPTASGSSDGFVYYARTYVEIQGVGYYVTVWQSPPADWSFYEGEEYNMTAEELYVAALGKMGTCELEVPRPQYTPSIVEDEVRADWVVPHTGSLTFNPFPTFNYRLAQDVALTIGSAGNFAEIGSVVELAYGTITVNSDFTLNYDPYEDLMGRAGDAGLKPELDINGNVFRYTGIENFEAHIVDVSAVTPSSGGGGEGEAPPLPVAYSSVPVTLAVSNHLPTLRGARTRSPDSSEFYLDSPVFADFLSQNTIDLRHIYFDPDGEEELDRLRIVDVKYDDRSAVEEASANNGRLILETPIGGLIQYDSILGILEVDRTERQLTVQAANDHVIHIKNNVSSDDAQASNFDHTIYPSWLEFQIEVTDGSTYVNSDGITEQYTWLTTIIIRPNVYTSASQWRTQASVPGVDYRTWVQELDPSLPDFDPDASVKVTDWALTAASRVSLLSENLTNVGGLDVDLFDGSFRRYIDLGLDASGGTSELAIPGLVYDSSVIHVSADEVATNGGFISLPVIQGRLQREPGQARPTSIDVELTWHGRGQDQGNRI